MKRGFLESPIKPHRTLNIPNLPHALRRDSPIPVNVDSQTLLASVRATLPILVLASVVTRPERELDAAQDVGAIGLMR